MGIHTCLFVCCFCMQVTDLVTRVIHNFSDESRVIFESLCHFNRENGLESFEIKNVCLFSPCEIHKIKSLKKFYYLTVLVCFGVEEDGTNSWWLLVKENYQVLIIGPSHVYFYFVQNKTQWRKKGKNLELHIADGQKTVNRWKEMCQETWEIFGRNQ